MAINPTVAGFKTQFPRFTPMYLPIYAEGTYFKGDIVYYSVTSLFYQCKKATTTALPTVTTDWELYNDSVLNYTQDSDILEAFEEAKINFNERLFPDETTALKVFYFSCSSLFNS